MARPTKPQAAPTPAQVLAPENGGSPAPAAAPVAADDSDDTKKKIADRDWIGADDKPCAEENAVGVRYGFLGRTKDGVTVPGDGRAVTVLFASLTPKARDMYAGFGIQTLFGNIVNTWLGDKSPDKYATAAEAIEARHQLINAADPATAKWIDRSGRTGPVIDREKIAMAVAQLALQYGKIAADGLDARYASELAKIDADDKRAAALRAVPEIGAKYNELMGRAVRTLEDVFAD